jgi:hypothetical protein
MNCEERSRLRRQYLYALQDWTMVGGTNRNKAQNPYVIAAIQKAMAAIYAVIEHRQEHGC